MRDPNRTEFPSTEGILLIRQGDKTIAVHLTAVTAILTAIANEPEVSNSRVWFSLPPSLDYYEVEATGNADRLYMWEGADPFAKAEVEASREEITRG